MNEGQPEHILFSAATVFYRKIKESPKLFTYGTHRLRMAKLDTGYFIIEEKWYAK